MGILLALGPSTRAALDEAGFDAEVCAGTHPEDVVCSIVRATRRHHVSGDAR